ncbi:hypothetical protein BBJ28_00000005 [Nothophytophthora sp. Chile5]|nr:hypothetical protein BBJ28_00000005 [Nothophytophthora sp. Chile5]
MALPQMESSAVQDTRFESLHEPLSDDKSPVERPPERYPGFCSLASRRSAIWRRNPAYVISRILSVIIVGLLYGTLFWQFDPLDTQEVMGVTFASVMFITIIQIAATPMFLPDREVSCSRSLSYVLAYALNMLPLAFLESVVFGSIVYWACGFVPSASAFLCFLVVLFLSHLVFTTSLFFLTLALPNLNAVQPIGLLFIAIYVLFAGFVVPKSEIPAALMWIYWLNPMAWAVRSIAVSQYRDKRFSKCTYDGVNYCEMTGLEVGEYALALFDVSSEKKWIWLGVGYLALSIVVFLALSCLALEYRRRKSPTSECAYIPSTSLDGENELVSDDIDLLEASKQSVPVLALRVDSTPIRMVTPVSIAFRNLKYTEPDLKNPKQPIDLLKGVGGYALPGTITAIMGSSGAGKTTLLDVIARRKPHGTIQGEVFLNGYPATDLAMRRAAGYCEEMDVHADTSTFREALTFSSCLRQGGDVSDTKKLEAVNECLQLLGLHSIADRVIQGSSKEQLKRLAIGVELAAQSSVLYLDEPTSGLDGQAAEAIMDCVRNVAETGHTILCTIQQPSRKVFSLLDRVLLLNRGGELAFFGDLGKQAVGMISYFESINGVQKLPLGYNPATWMLETIATSRTDFAKHFRRSGLYQRMQTELNRHGLTRPSPGLLPVDSSKRVASQITQTRLVLQRFMRLYWRTPSYTVIRLVVYAFVALLFGLLYVGSDYRTYQEVNTGVGMLYLMTILTGVISLISVIPITIDQLASFHRERAAQTYNAVWFSVGSGLVEVPYTASCALLFTAVFFPMVGFSGFSQFLLYWVTLTLHMLLQTSMGQFFGTVLPRVDVASTIALLFDCIFYVLMGFNPMASRIPDPYQWIYHVTPQQYTMATFVSVMFGDCSGAGDDAIGCQTLLEAPVSLEEDLSIKSYVEDVFSMKHHDVARNLIMLLGYIVLFRVLAYIALRYVNHTAIRENVWRIALMCLNALGIAF